MKVQIETSAKSLEKGNRSWLDFLALNTAFNGLVGIKLCDGGTDNTMHRRGQITRGRGPITQRNRHGDDPWARRYPGHDGFHQVRRGLGHASACTRGVKAAQGTLVSQRSADRSTRLRQVAPASRW